MVDHHFNPTISALNDCIISCEVCARACLEEKNIDMLRDCIRSDLDCAELCRAAVTMVARGSPSAPAVCAAAAEAIRRCAEECEKHQDMHKHCRECAKACRSALEECQAVAA